MFDSALLFPLIQSKNDYGKMMCDNRMPWQLFFFSLCFVLRYSQENHIWCISHLAWRPSACYSPIGQCQRTDNIFPQKSYINFTAAYHSDNTIFETSYRSINMDVFLSTLKYILVVNKIQILKKFKNSFKNLCISLEKNTAL